MTKRKLALFALLVGVFVRSQDVELPPDFRQLNLVEFNSSLLNPVFSLDRNSPESIALWTRWQWQSVDGDPTTIFLNYTRQLNANSSVGAGFLQHNTGIFLLTGGALNYAQSFDLPSEMKILLGLNVLAYQRELAADPFDPNVQVLPGLSESNDFILQAAPGVQFQYQRFSIGFVGENLLEYNFSNSRTESSSDQKVYVGLMSYNFPVTIFGTTDELFIQPTIYLKSLPGLDNQFGFTTLFSTPKFWAQAGYNNFYGISGGVGGRFFKNWSVGALMEFGTSSDLEGQDPTFEFVTAYTFGPRNVRKSIVEEYEEEELAVEEEDEQKQQEEELAKAEALAREAAGKRQDSINKVRAAEALAKTQRLQQQRADSIAKSERESALAAERLKQQQTLDSIEAARRQEALAAAQKEKDERRKDSVAAVREQQAIAAARKEREDRRRDSIAAVREQEAIAAARKEREDRRRDSIAAVREQQAVAAARKEREDRRRDSIAAVREQQAIAAARKEREDSRRDSIAAVREQEALAEAKRIREQKRQDSIQAAKLAEAEKEKVQPKAGEKYEEVANADGLQPGFYLIANVFGTQKYFERFMKTLSDQGLEPKSFYRSLNKYNYVYLKRYNTIQEARRARDSKFDGKYPDKTWIFRVVGN